MIQRFRFQTFEIVSHGSSEDPCIFIFNPACGPGGGREDRAGEAQAWETSHCPGTQVSMWPAGRPGPEVGAAAASAPSSPAERPLPVDQDQDVPFSQAGRMKGPRDSRRTAGPGPGSPVSGKGGPLTQNPRTLLGTHPVS